MAKTEVKSKLEFDIKFSLELTLNEAKALNEMVKYGSKAFLEGYYKHLGKSYLEPHEVGIHSLFDTVRQSLPEKIHTANDLVNKINVIKSDFKI